MIKCKNWVLATICDNSWNMEIIRAPKHVSIFNVYILGSTWHNFCSLPLKWRHHQHLLLHSLVEKFEWWNREKMTAFEEKECVASPWKSSMSQHSGKFDKNPAITVFYRSITRKYFLFSDPTSMLAGKKFSLNEEVIAEHGAYLDEKVISYKIGSEDWQNRYKKCALLWMDKKFYLTCYARKKLFSNKHMLKNIFVSNKPFYLDLLNYCLRFFF